MNIRHVWIAAVALGLLFAACDKETRTGGFPAAGGPGIVAPTLESTSGAFVIAQGAWDVPTAQYFDDPGFHFVVEAVHDVPVAARVDAGWKIVVALRVPERRDACASPHPLSGCVTVDWADDPARPHVPASGLFDQTLRLVLNSGTHTLWLRPDGAISDTGPRSAGAAAGSYTPLSRVETSWSAELPEVFRGGGLLRLHLVLTNFRAPPARVTYEVRLEPP
ncbi:MAG: hypothetical protein ACKVVT_12060 [Dehalococcoidia bacterium]